MRISSKLILVQLFLLLCLSLGVFAILHWYVLPGIESIEKQSVSTQVERVKKALQAEQQRLYIQARDWGAWDDTYHYVHEPSRVYEASNLSEGTLAALQMDLLLIVHKSGTVVREQFSHALEQHQTFWIEDLSSTPWGADHPLQQVVAQTTGLVMTPAGLMVLAGHPIVPSDSKGEVRGYLYFGRFVDDALASELAQRLELSLQLEVVDAADGGQKVTFISADKLQASGALAVLNRDNQVLQIRVQEPRPFYQQAIDGARYAVLSIMVAGVLICLLVFILLKKMLVSPILLLQRQAELFGKNNQLSEFEPLRRDDELGALSSSFITMAKRLQDSWWMLARERNDYLDASHTDPLTKLRNRRYLEQQLSEDSVWYPPQNWLFMMFDLDHFKAVNDRFGHDVGDLVLQQFADLLSELSRSDDYIIRYGGEEFAMICRNTDETMACSIAERIRQRVEQYRFGSDEKPISLTCSIGFFSLFVEPHHDTDMPWRAMLKVADLSLYAAKHSGRNTWVGLKCMEPCAQSHYPDKPDQVGERLLQKQLSLYSALSPVSRVRW